MDRSTRQAGGWVGVGGMWPRGFYKDGGRVVAGCGDGWIRWGRGKRCDAGAVWRVCPRACLPACLPPACLPASTGGSLCSAARRRRAVKGVRRGGQKRGGRGRPPARPGHVKRGAVSHASPARAVKREAGREGGRLAAKPGGAGECCAVACRSTWSREGRRSSGIARRRSRGAQSDLFLQG